MKTKLIAFALALAAILPTAKAFTQGEFITYYWNWVFDEGDEGNPYWTMGRRDLPPLGSGISGFPMMSGADNVTYLYQFGTGLTVNNTTKVVSGFSGAYADLSGKPTIPAAQVQSDWNAVSGLGVILNKPTIPSVTRTFSGNLTPTLNSAAVIDASKDAIVSYSVDISVTSILLAGTSGTVFLEYADNSGMSTNLVTVGQSTLSTGGVLNVTNVGTATLSGVIPAGKYRRIRTANNTGTPVFTARSSQETKL